MDIFDFLTFALVLLFVAYIIERARQLFIAYSQADTGKTLSSFSLIKAYRDRRDVVETARKNHPNVFVGSK